MPILRSLAALTGQVGPCSLLDVIRKKVERNPPWKTGVQREQSQQRASTRSTLRKGAKGG